MPQQTGREVLAAFQGQFDWVIFIARAYPLSRGGVKAPGYASPAHWMPRPDPPDEHNT